MCPCNGSADPFFLNLIYLFLTVPGLCCCAGFSPVATSGGYSLVAVFGLLTQWLLLLEHRLYGAWATLAVACGLGSCAWRALEHRLSYSKACGIFLDQGSNPCLLPWQADSLLLSHQGNQENQEVQILNHWISKEVPVMFYLHFGSGCTEVLTLC